MIFSNRQDAGKQLVKKLRKYQNKEAIVFALPRGGVVVAKEISKSLKFPLDLIVVRKIGHPLSPEYAIGAVSENNALIGDPIELSQVDKKWLEQKREAEAREARRRRQVYLKSKKPLGAKNKIAIIVDDGIATGWTMLAAIKEIKNQNPKKIVVVVPVLPAQIKERFEKEADEFIFVEAPAAFLAVGEYYKNFPQVSDEEVIEALKGE